MASSASDAGHGEKEIREEIIKTGAVDAIVSIGTNFFYTRSLPCTLWFFDKGKPEDRRNKVLMVDARNIYRVISRKIRDFSPEQLDNLSAIAWLYRGETENYLELAGSYLEKLEGAIAQLPEVVQPMQVSVEWLAERLQQFAEEMAQPKNTVQMNLFEDVPEAEINEHLAGLWEVLQELTSVQQRCRVDGQTLMADLAGLEIPKERTNAAQIDCTQAFEPFIPRLKAYRKEIDELHKLLNRGLDLATKKLKASKLKSWKTKEISDRAKQLDTEHEGARDAIKMIRYWYEQAHWLQSRFPEAVFVDVPGLCKGVTRDEIAEQDSSLTPGRYVGVASVVDDEDEEAFEERMKKIHQELAELNEEAVELAGAIQSNFGELMG
jgi:type I restriction enzyme M protein